MTSRFSDTEHTPENGKTASEARRPVVIGGRATLAERRLVDLAVLAEDTSRAAFVVKAAVEQAKRVLGRLAA